MLNDHNVDDVITVDAHSELEHLIEKGYFYLDNRVFNGPYEKPEDASRAALENCNLQSTGECRAIYHGSVRFNPETSLKEPLADMRQADQIAATV